MSIFVRSLHRVLTVACVSLLGTGCAFQGVNSLPLPGAEGHEQGASTYYVELANIGALERNSPVMVNDVTVGSIGEMKVEHWHAKIRVSLRPGVVVPRNAVARVGQTSLLGSMHLELDPPPGQQPSGRLEAGATIPLVQSSTYPSTEQTLASLSLVVNGGGLGQIGDVIHNFNAALSGRGGQVRDLLGRLDELVGTFDRSRDHIVQTIDALNRFSASLADQREVVSTAIRAIRPALDVLLRERPRITTALDKLRVFSNTATDLVHDTQADLVKNLQNLEPTVRALADIGPELGIALASAPIFPFNQNLIDRALRGDYFNLFAIVDLTVPRLKRTLALGTRWGQEGATLPPAPGDPYFSYYAYDPLSAPIGPQPPDDSPPVPGAVLPGQAPPVGQLPAEVAPTPQAPPPGAVPSAGPAPADSAPAPGDSAVTNEVPPAIQTASITPPSPGIG